MTYTTSEKYAGGRAGNRFLNLPVGAAAAAAVGTLMPWVGIFGINLGPVQGVSDGWPIVAAAVLALCLVLVNIERQRTLVPAMLLLGYTGLAAAITIASAPAGTLQMGVWVTLGGVFAALAGIAIQLLRPKPIEA